MKWKNTRGVIPIAAIIMRAGIAFVVSVSPAPVAAAQDGPAQTFQTDFQLRASSDDSAQHQDPTSLEPVSDAPTFGSAGSWRFLIYTGGAAVYDHSPDDYYYNLHVGAEYFAADHFSIDFEVGGLYFDESGEPDGRDTGAANFNILFRWYFLQREDWALYVDGGAGVMYTFSEPIPAEGSRFDFTPQAGLGVCFDLPGDSGGRLMLGARWHHISNSRVYGSDQNPARNSAMAYVGLSFPWGE